MAPCYSCARASFERRQSDFQVIGGFSRAGIEFGVKPLLLLVVRRMRVDAMLHRNRSFAQVVPRRIARAMVGPASNLLRPTPRSARYSLSRAAPSSGRDVDRAGAGLVVDVDAADRVARDEGAAQVDVDAHDNIRCAVAQGHVMYLMFISFCHNGELWTSYCSTLRHLARVDFSFERTIQYTP